MVDALTGIKQLKEKIDAGTASDDEIEKFKHCERIREDFKKKYYDEIVRFMPKEKSVG